MKWQYMSLTRNVLLKKEMCRSLDVTLLASKGDNQTEQQLK